MRVHHVKKARKTHKKLGIKKGQSYFWWKHRRGPKQVSLTPPKQSQLTNSDYERTLALIREGMEGIDDVESAQAYLEDSMGELENLKDELDEKISNMDTAFPNGCPTLELLQERVADVEGYIQDFSSAVNDLGEDDASVEDILQGLPI